MIEMPDNPGTSITNWAEKLTWKIANDSFIWVKALTAAREGCIWIQHYPEELSRETNRMFPESFSIVSFTCDEDAEVDAHNAGTMTFVSEDPDDPEGVEIEGSIIMPTVGDQGTLGDPSWESVSRERVERLIGQPLAPIPGD